MEITLQNVKRKFTQWRSLEHKGKIPEELLKLASTCASKYGISKTASTLHISGLKLNYARKTYPFVEEKSNSISNIEFIEAKFKRIEPTIESQIIDKKSPTKALQVLYEVENKFGIKIRVFSESEQLQKNIFSSFSSRS